MRININLKILTVAVFVLLLLPPSPVEAASVISAQKAARLEKCAIENYRDYSQTEKYIKFLSLRAKKYAFLRNHTAAADDLRAILYLTNAPKNSSTYRSYLNRLNKSLDKIYFSTADDNRFEVAKNLYLEKNYLAAGYEFKTLLDAKYREVDCYEYLGDISQKLKRPDLAINYYNKAYALYPDNPVLNFKLGKYYESTGDEALALESFNRAILLGLDSSELREIISIYEQKLAQNSKNQLYYEILGHCYKGLGDYKKAYPLYQKALELYPQDIFLQYNLGALLQATGDYYGAIKVYEAILAKNPYESQIRIEKAKCLTAVNKAEQAAKEYQIVLAIYPDSMGAKYGLYSLLAPKVGLERAIASFYPLNEKFVPSSKFYFEFAQYLDKMNKYNDAIGALRLAINSDKNNVAAYLMLYDLYLARGNEAKAFEVAKEAYRALPNNPDIKQLYSTVNQNTTDRKNSIALSYLKNKEYTKALNIYKEIEPKTLNVYLAMANCYKLLKDYPKAIEMMNITIKASPKESDLYYALALIYVDKKDNDGALKQLTKALSLDKNNTKALKLANYLVQENINKAIDEAYVLYKKNDYKKAMDALVAINKRYPKDAQPYYYIGLIHDAEGRYPEALENYRMAVKYNQYYDIVYFSIAQLLEKYGKGKEALEAYERFLAGDVNDAEMLQKAQQRVIILSKQYY